MHPLATAGADDRETLESSGNAYLAAFAEIATNVRLGIFTDDVPAGRLNAFLAIAGAFCRFDESVVVGVGTLVDNGAWLQRGCELGDNCVVANNAIVGELVILHDGVRVFGFVLPPREGERIVIGPGTMVAMDALVQADVGARCYIAASARVTRPVPDGCVVFDNDRVIHHSRYREKGVPRLVALLYEAGFFSPDLDVRALAIDPVAWPDLSGAGFNPSVAALGSIETGGAVALGEPYRPLFTGTAYPNTGVVLGDGFRMDQRSIVGQGSRTGNGVLVGPNCHVKSGVTLGNRVVVLSERGRITIVGADVVVGDRAIVAGHIAERAVIEDDAVILGGRLSHGLTGVNGELVIRQNWDADGARQEPPVIRRGALVFGSVFGGVEIGERSIVLPGALVSRDVPPGHVAYGRNKFLSVEEYLDHGPNPLVAALYRAESLTERLNIVFSSGLVMVPELTLD